MKKMMAFLAIFSASCAMGQAAAVSYDETYGTDHVQLTLAESVEMALASDESIESAAAGRDAAKWVLSSARRSKGPVVSWNSQAYRIGGGNYKTYNQVHDEYGDPHSVTRQVVSGYVWGLKGYPVVSEQTTTVGSYAYNNTFSNSWNLTVPIYTGGQLEGRIAAGRYQLNQADLTLENTRQTVRYQTAEAYARLIHQVDLERIAKEAVDMASVQLQLISDQYSEGAVAKADVLTMEVRLANYRQNLVSTAAATAVAKSALASIVGLPQDADIEAVDVFSYEPYEKDLSSCEDYALHHRPDGLAADYAVKVAEAQKDMAKSGYRPKVSGVVGKSIASNSPFHSERSDAWEAGIGISWNIFDSGVTDANVKQAKAVTEQYLAEARRMQKKIRLETRSAYIEMKAAEKNIRDTATAVKQAEESYMIAQVRYEEGVDILLTVTDAQERLTQARSNYYSALYQYNLYRAALEKAMGVPVAFDPALYVEAEQKGASAAGALEASKLLEEVAGEE